MLSIKIYVGLRDVVRLLPVWISVDVAYFLSCLRLLDAFFCTLHQFMRCSQISHVVEPNVYHHLCPKFTRGLPKATLGRHNALVTSARKRT